MRISRVAARPSSSGRVPLAPRLFMTVLALAFFLAGVGLLIQHLSILRTWRSVEATVVRSEVIGHRNNKQRSMYRGEVELAYSVEGRNYQTPETFSTASSREDSVRQQMDITYAVGTRHRVFYNPDNPHSLRWNVGGNFTFFLLPILFTGVGLILIAVCYFLWRLPFPPRLVCGRCGNQGRLDDRFCPRCGDALSPVASTAPPQETTDAGGTSEIPSQRENPAALLLVGAFFGLPGLALCMGAAYMGINNYAATQTWPTAEATVTRSGIEATRDHDGMPVYRLGVEFDYEGDQHPKHAAGQSIYVSGSYPWIVQRLERFPVGSRHQVRVNPRDPADIRFDLESPLLNWLPTSRRGAIGVYLRGPGCLASTVGDETTLRQLSTPASPRSGLLHGVQAAGQCRNFSSSCRHILKSLGPAVDERPHERRDRAFPL